MPAYPLPSVLRHMTLPPTGSLKSTFATPKMCHLNPKATLPTGKIPGFYQNLFVTDKYKPNVRDDDLSGNLDGKTGPVAAGGANFRVTDIAPRTKGSMHATESLDFLIVHKGNVTLHLDNGEKTLIKEGEVIVQRGAVHAWENDTDDWVRMFVVLLHAD